MSGRTCGRCGHEFKYPSQLKRHLQRKTPCAPVISPAEGNVPDDEGHYCDYCNRRFAQIAGKYRHQRSRCPVVKEGPEAMKRALEARRSIPSAADRKIADLERKVERLLEKAEERDGGGGAAATTVMHDSSTNVTNNIQQQTTINFNAFGQEDVRHMAEFVRRILASGRSVHEIIEQMGKARWGDPKHPENGTMVLPNVKGTRVRTRRADGTWEDRDGSLVHRQAHTALTNQAYNNQPKTEKEAKIASPVLKRMDAIDKGQEPFPTGVYRMVAASGRVHKHHRR